MTSSLRTPTAALIGSFVCILLSPISLGFFTFTVFFETLAKELKWGHSVLGLAITVGTLTIAVVAPIAGRFVERIGSRKLLLLANVALVPVVAAMSVLATSLAGLYLAMALIGVLGSCYMVTIPKIVSSWYDRRRGLALGFAMSGVGLGSALLAPLVAAMIASSGWQSAYVLLSGIVLVVSLPVTFFLVHENPVVAEAEAKAAKTNANTRIDLQFVLLSAAILLIALGLHSIHIFFTPMMLQRGVDLQTAAEYFSAVGIAMFAGRLGCGFILDRFPANRVGAVIMLGAAIGIVILNNAPTGPLLIVGAVLFGLGMSAELDLLSYIISRLYPIEHFSRFFGLAYSSFMIGASASPPLLGGFYDHFGNFAVGTVVAACITAVSALLLIAMQRTPISAPARLVTAAAE